MLFRNDAKDQCHEQDLDATGLGTQVASRLNPPFEHGLICVVLQNFDVSMGPIFPVLSWRWAVNYSRYSKLSSSGRRKKLILQGGNFCCSFLASTGIFIVFRSAFMMVLNGCQLSTTLQSWPSLAFVECTTSRKPEINVIVTATGLLFQVMCFPRMTPFGFLLYAVLQIRLAAVYQVAILDLAFLFYFWSPTTDFSLNWEVCQTKKVTDLAMFTVPGTPI